MKKLLHNSLTLAITLALILNTVFIGGTFAVSADDSNSTGYTVTSTTCRWQDKTFDNENNLIYGISSEENKDNDVTNKQYTNGEVETGKPYGILRLSFPLTYSSTISKVIVSSKNGYTIDGKQVASRLAEYDIYIADSYEDLYNEENKVASFSTDSTDTGYHLAIDTFEFSESYAKTGKYIGFDITKGSNGGAERKQYIAEIEVFGVTTYAVTSTTCGTNDKTVDSENNLINGIVNIEDQEKNDTKKQYIDGKVDTATPFAMLKLSFPLTYSSTISRVIVTSRNGHSGKATRLAEYDIYIADSYAELYNEGNKVASFSTDSTSTSYYLAIDTFEFSESYAKTGKYIGFNITKGSMGGDTGKQYIAEIEVFGTEHSSVTATAGNGGSITPKGYKLLTDDPIQYTFTPDDGYKLDKVLVNGNEVESTDGTYTFTKTQEIFNHNINVAFYLIGDANNDGVINNDDLVLVKRCILELEEGNKYMDVDDNDEINILDLVSAWELMQNS